MIIEHSKHLVKCQQIEKLTLVVVKLTETIIYVDK